MLVAGLGVLCFVVRFLRGFFSSRVVSGKRSVWLIYRFEEAPSLLWLFGSHFSRQFFYCCRCWCTPISCPALHFSPFSRPRSATLHCCFVSCVDIVCAHDAGDSVTTSFVFAILLVCMLLMFLFVFMFMFLLQLGLSRALAVAQCREMQVKTTVTLPMQVDNAYVHQRSCSAGMCLSLACPGAAIGLRYCGGQTSRLVDAGRC